MEHGSIRKKKEGFRPCGHEEEKIKRKSIGIGRKRADDSAAKISYLVLCVFRRTHLFGPESGFTPYSLNFEFIGRPTYQRAGFIFQKFGDFLGEF